MVRLFVLVLLLFASGTFAASITIHEEDAVVWHHQQTITGEMYGFIAETLTLHINENSFSVSVMEDHKFSFQLILQDSINKIWLEFTDSNPVIASDTLVYRLGYTPTPLVKPFATTNGDNVTLHATTIENPYGDALEYYWVADSSNPAISEITDRHDSLARVEIPDMSGEYYYNLLIVAEEDSSWFQTLVIREGDNLQAFDIDSDYPPWMDQAIIYQITPYNFVANGTFPDITAKLPEIKKLGINTIWLQPVFKSSYRGQGYDVVDYFSLNPALGTESQLRELIRKAKDLEMRVLFDLVLNHTSIKHPYAQDVNAHGEDSHYYKFYQHEDDGKPYSSFYNVDENGLLFYFWEDLVNLNYESEEVQRWMLEACKHWVREFDIDGYRLDAIWGVNSRMPSFAERLQIELKSMKPDLLLLAEDKGSDPEVFDLGFDAAYDWTRDTSWVSQTSWEYEYDENESKTIFNYPEVNERDSLMEEALFLEEKNEHKLLRYLENNDLYRFINGHGLKRTKMAAALLFALPGIPMLYNGQEIGFRGHPYETSAVFNRNWTIQAADKEGLFPYYQKLIQLHKQYTALSDTAMEPLSVSDGAIIAFRRFYGEENFVVIANFDSLSAKATVDLHEVFSDESSLEGYWLRDVLSGNTYRFGSDKSAIEIPMEGYGVRWLLVEHGEPTGAMEQNSPGGVQVYPNPSNGTVTVESEKINIDKIRVINMSGATVFEENISIPNSKHQLFMDLPSTIYLLQISNRIKTLTTRIVIQ